MKAFDKEMFLIFLPPSVLFFLMLLTSLIALPQVSVSDILVARSLGLCLVAAGDCFFFQQATREKAREICVAAMRSCHVH